MNAHEEARVAGERGLGNETDAMSPLSQRPWSGPLWAALLAGPVIWGLHFAVVYLAAEVACRGSGSWSWDDGMATAVTVMATVVAVVAIGVAALMTERLRRRTAPMHHELVVVGLALDALFALSVLAVGIPALVLEPC